MAALMSRVVFLLVSLGSHRLVAGHRGEEDGNRSVAFETMPRATFHVEGQRSTASRHKFQHVEPGSLLEESSGKLMAQDETNLDMEAKNPSSGASITINFGDGLPMARFAGVSAEESPQGHHTTITIQHHEAPVSVPPVQKATIGVTVGTSASQATPPAIPPASSCPRTLKTGSIGCRFPW
jgi:hypothetical protein